MIVLRFLYELLIYGNFYISFGAALLCVERYFTDPYDLELFLLVFFASFCLYNLQRLLLVSNERSGNKSQNFIQRNRMLLWGLTALAFVPGVFLFFTTLILQQQIVFIIGGIVALAYFIPGISLRKLPGLKAILVGLCWAIISAVLWFKGEWSEFPWPQFFDKFLFITALAIVFDIRDYESDISTGTRSLPVLVGRPLSQIIAWFLLLISAFIQYAEGVPVIAVLLIFFLCSLIVRWSNEKRKEDFYVVGVDGMIIIRALLIIFFSQNSILYPP